MKKIIRNAISYFLMLFVINFLYFILFGKETVINNIVAFISTNCGIVIVFIITVFNSKVNRFPENVTLPYTTTIIYAVINIIVNFFLMCINEGKGKIAYTTNVVLLVVFILIYHRIYIISKAMEEAEEKISIDREFVKRTADILKLYLYDSTKNVNKIKVERAYDAVRVSPILSNEESLKCEMEISKIIDNLDNLSDDEIEYQMDKIVSLIEKRNMYLK